MTYYIKHTEKNVSKPDIDIPENSLNVETDITLFGRKKLEYGQDMNTNLLRILENFACPEDPMNVGWPHVNIAGTVSDTNKRVLSTPSAGQLWFNKTANSMYIFDGIRWIRIAKSDDIAFNWGTLYDGEYIPIPDSSTGHPFSLGDCTWIASMNTGVLADSTECFIDSAGLLTATYTTGGSIVSTYASVLVVAIRGNINMGDIGTPFSIGATDTSSEDDDIDVVTPPPEVQSLEYPSMPDLYALNGYDYETNDSIEDPVEVFFDDSELIQLESFDESVEDSIKRDPVFFEEYNETYGFRYTTIGLVFEEDDEGEGSAIYSVINKEKKLLAHTSKKYVLVSSDGLGRDNVRPDDDSFDAWILLDGNASFTYGIKSKKDEDSMDYVNFIVYLSNDSSLDTSDQFGQISYRMAKK